MVLLTQFAMFCNYAHKSISILAGISFLKYVMSNFMFCLTLVAIRHQCYVCILSVASSYNFLLMQSTARLSK